MMEEKQEKLTNKEIRESKPENEDEEDDGN